MAVVEEAFPLGAIPERLKCSLCTALARGAWKLPCCDQIICGSCFETLPEDACPICAFTPLDKEKCIVSTSLRTTIAVFLRHAEKRHNDALAKEAKEKAVDKPSNEIIVQPGQPSMTGSDGLPNNFQSTNEHVISQTSNALPQGQASIQADLNGAPFHPMTSGMQQHQYEFDGIYGPGMAGMNMGFPMMNEFTMTSMNPMMLPPHASNGFGGFGTGLDWNAQMEHNYTQQNMYRQTQDHDSNHISHGPPSSEQARGGYRGRYAPRGSASFRGGRGAHSVVPHPVAPVVVVEGAPTGPSAMRNGTDSRGRNYRGRGSNSYTSTSGHHESNTATIHEPARGNLISSTSRGRSKTRSATPERSPPIVISRHRSRSGERRSRPSSSRSRSRSCSRSNSRDRTRRNHTERSSRDRSISRRQSDSSKSKHSKIVEKSIKIKGCSLADRIERRSAPQSRSRSPTRKDIKSLRSSHRHRRRRSTSKSRRRHSRSRSRSRERRKRSDHRISGEDTIDESKKHKRDHNVFEDNKDEKTIDMKSSRRRRSRDRDAKKSSRRGNAKYEISASELRRLESERDHSRYN